MLDPYATLSTSSPEEATSRTLMSPPPFPSALRDRHSRGLMLMSEEGNAVEGGGGRRCWKGQYIYTAAEISIWILDKSSL